MQQQPQDELPTLLFEGVPKKKGVRRVPVFAWYILGVYVVVLVTAWILTRVFGTYAVERYFSLKAFMFFPCLALMAFIWWCGRDLVETLGRGPMLPDTVTAIVCFAQFATYIAGVVWLLWANDVNLTTLSAPKDNVALMVNMGVAMAVGAFGLQYLATYLRQGAAPTVGETLGWMRKADNTTEPGVMRFGVFCVCALLLYFWNPGGVMTRFKGTAVFVTIVAGVCMLGLAAPLLGSGNEGGPLSSAALAKAGTPLGRATAMRGAYVVCALIVSALLLAWCIQATGIADAGAESHAGFVAIDIIVLLVMLGLLANLVKSHAKDNFPGLRLLADIVAFIPCLLLSTLGSLGAAVFGTAAAAPDGANDRTAILVAILVCAAYFGASWLYPRAADAVERQGGVMLIADPRTLSQPTSVPLPDAALQAREYRYSLSFWFQIIEPIPATDKSYHVFDMAAGFPALHYFPSDNQLVFTCRSSASSASSSSPSTLYRTEARLQKWTHVVISYYGGTLDLFVDNRLVNSSSAVAKMNYDPIAFGDLSLHGHINRCVYFNQPISIATINTLHQLGPT